MHESFDEFEIWPDLAGFDHGLLAALERMKKIL